MNRKSIIKLIISILFMSLLLTGCVSEKDKNKMFDMLREAGCIEVGNRQWDDYDELKVVDQSPVPVNIYYYIYRQGPETYRIHYSSINNDQEDVYTYKATVEISFDDQHTETRIYSFEKRKILKFFWEWEFMDISSENG